MKTNAEQQQWLDTLSRKNQQVRLHRLEARARLEKLIEQELSVLLVEQSQLANEALKAGVSKTRIGRAIGTANWDTIKEVLGLTDPSVWAVEDVTAPTPPVQAEDGVWTFYPDRSVLVIHRWKEHGTMARAHQDALEIPLVVDANGMLESSYGTDPETTRRTKINWDLWSNIRAQVNAAMGLVAPVYVPPEYTPAPGDDYWAAYQGEEDDEYRESEA